MHFFLLIPIPPLGPSWRTHHFKLSFKVENQKPILRSCQQTIFDKEQQRLAYQYVELQSSVKDENIGRFQSFLCLAYSSLNISILDWWLFTDPCVPVESPCVSKREKETIGKILRHIRLSNIRFQNSSSSFRVAVQCCSDSSQNCAASALVSREICFVTGATYLTKRQELN